MPLRVNTAAKPGNRLSELVYRETRLKKEVSFMFYLLTEGKVKLQTVKAV